MWAFWKKLKVRSVEGKSSYNEERISPASGRFRLSKSGIPNQLEQKPSLGLPRVSSALFSLYTQHHLLEKAISNERLG